MKKRFIHWNFVCSLAVIVALCFSLRGITWAAAPPMVKSPVTHALPLPACLSNPTLSPATPRCYSPQQIRTAYGVNGLLDAGITGKGSTIVIIADTPTPTLRSSLHAYDQMFGLNDPTLNVLTPFGAKTGVGEYEEMMLDVEMSHVLAPDATIDVVLTDNTNGRTDEDFAYKQLRPIKYAVDHNLGSTISPSYTIGESCVDSAYLQYEHGIFQSARDKGISIFMSSGDFGAAVPSCSSVTTPSGRLKGVGVPGSDPLVTSVGGTTLNAAVGTGTYGNETTWNQPPFASGGGFSSVFPRPDYQQGITGIGKMRGVPDVSFDADASTGMVIVYSEDGTTYTVTSSQGTSAGAPAWAGLDALFNQYAGKRLGFLNEALYRILKSSSYSQAFHDIRTGNNSVTGSDATGQPVPVTGYSAGPGWDAATGIGTPNADALAPLLKQYVHKGDGKGL